MKNVMVTLVTILLSCQLDTEAASVEEWRSRVVYQVLTDRFATDRDPAPTEQCADLTTWCGGNWRGIASKLDYIKDLGADAVWISPIVLNVPGNYHAYAALNIYEMEPHFGTKEDLRHLVTEAHKRDIYIMVDVVPNHMGRQDGCNDTGCYPEGVAVYNFTKFTPFDQNEHYHEFCMWSGDNDAQTEMEICRIFNLPDLNETNPWVRKILLDWVANLTRDYDIDGYRIDTTRHMGMEFWPDYQSAAGAYCIGEVWNEQNVSYVADYQTRGQLDAVFHFPLHHALNQVFRDGQSFTKLNDVIKESRKHFDDLDAVGLFVDNHDMARFLNTTQDVSKFKNALTYVMFGQGVPFIYYGSEQSYHGGRDPYCRESLWPNYDQEAVLYKFIKESLSARKQAQSNIVKAQQSELLTQDDVMVFSRGTGHQVLVALTKVGKGNDKQVSIQNFGVSDGTVYENIHDSSDEIEVKGGGLTIQLTNGEPKVYISKVVGSGATRQGGALILSLLMAVNTVLMRTF